MMTTSNGQLYSVRLLFNNVAVFFVFFSALVVIAIAIISLYALLIGDIL